MGKYEYFVGLDAVDKDSAAYVLSRRHGNQPIEVLLCKTGKHDELTEESKNLAKYFDATFLYTTDKNPNVILDAADSDITLIPVHINKARTSDYYYDWSSNIGGWVRGAEISERMKRMYKNPIR
jgi:hypothetical protein